MSRSIDTIFQEIQTEKNTMSTLVDKLTNYDGTTTINTEQDLLNQLQSENKVAIWKLWAYITAVNANFEEQLWDEFIVNIENIKDSTPVYNAKWWVEKSNEWQDGYTLTIDSEDNSISYDVIDETARKVGHSAVSDSNGKVILKIRGSDTNLLTAPQLASYTSYINTLKPVGDRVIINNYEPDDIKMYYDIYYNPLIDIATITSEVENTINDYLANINFNSELNITDLTDKLQLIEGVVSPVFDNAEGKHAGEPYVAFTNYYTAIAGYCAIDPAFALTTTITYISKII